MIKMILTINSDIKVEDSNATKHATEHVDGLQQSLISAKPLEPEQQRPAQYDKRGMKQVSYMSRDRAEVLQLA